MVIPARLGSSRVPDKALATIAGLPLVEHVRRRAIAADVGPVVVATDDDRVEAALAPYGARVFRTGAHPNGTLRVAEVARTIPADQVLNVQGDQPLLDPDHVRALARRVASTGQIATLATPWPASVAADDRAVVKVWITEHGMATEFSRDALAPGPLRHLGLYGFPRQALRRVTTLPVAPRAVAAGLEQLTWLDAGLPIAVEVVAEAAPAVDTSAQLAQVRALLGG